MGCDIHLYTEIKLDGEWWCYSHPDVRRNYDLFTKMAGVRDYYSDIEPISQPRGVPADASKVVKFCADDCGEYGHSHSYLTAAEISELYAWILRHECSWYKRNQLPWFAENFGYFFGNWWSAFHDYPKERPEGVEDVRFVFWFDN